MLIEKLSSVSKGYYSSLDGLRGLLACFVLLHHLEQVKVFCELNSIHHLGFVQSLGHLSVTFFFVLSGFIITLLLLKEIKLSGDVHIAKFYMRRVMRIWPVYYLIIFVVLLLYYMELLPRQILHYEITFEQLPLYVLMLPQFSLVLLGGIPFFAHAWSVGVEELFYLFWPWVVRKTENLSKTIKIIVAIYFTVTCVAIFLHFVPILGHKNFFKTVMSILLINRFGTMMIGAWGAYMVHTNPKHKIFDFIYSKAAQLLALGMILYGYSCMVFVMIPHEVMSVFFLIAILNLAFNDKAIIRLNSKWLIYLGKRSYGIYLYHVLIQYYALKLVLNFIPAENDYLLNIVLYPLSTFLVIVISHYSYEYFEKKFLELNMTRYSALK